MRHQPTPQTWLKAVSRVYTQVICVKTILISALLAIGHCISHLFHKSPRKKSIYTGVSFQLKQGFSSVYNYQTQSEREVKMCNNCTRQMLIFRPFLYIVTHHVGNQNLKEYRHAYEVRWSTICILCFAIV